MYERRPSFFREDTLPGRRVEAKVKWFNASKGFGFVTPSDGSQDAVFADGGIASRRPCFAEAVSSYLEMYLVIHFG